MNSFNKDDIIKPITIRISDFPIIESLLVEFIFPDISIKAEILTNIYQKKDTMLSKVFETKLDLALSMKIKSKAKECLYLDFKIDSDKCYVLSKKSKIGDWDGDILNTMDVLDISKISGIYI